LLDMPGSGKNPFKDLRVRRAVYQAVDARAIHDKVMRGSSRINGLMVAQAVQGYDPRLDQRLSHDPEAARRLLAEAGYPQGFPVTLDCPNDRYANDEAICQAVVPMLARVGIKVSLNAQTKSKFFDKVRSHQTSFFLGGWSSTTFDAHYTLSNLLVDQPPGPSWNFGRYTAPRMEALTRAVAVEMDPARRQQLVSEALQFARDDVAYVPLHDQTVVWAARDGVEVPLAADNAPRLQQIRIAR
jgi:peptide/nickel transport system substrate-binding protein